MRPLTTVTFIRSLARRNLTRKPLRHVVARSKLIAAFSTTASWITPPPRLGQPTHETHPHLLKSGEVTQGCSAIEYAVRRAKLASQLPEGGVAIIPAATLKYRSGPVFYEFHQDPDFYYLTGFLEQDAVAVIEKVGPSSGAEHAFHLFVREKNAHAELWDGARTGIEAAAEYFNADKAYNVDDLRTGIRPLLMRAKIIYADDNTQSSNHTIRSMLDGTETQALRPIMHKLRVIKSDAEVAVMRQAGRISGRAYNKAMAEDFKMEKDLCAFLEYEFKRGGCQDSAYVPVVGGGKNALSLHYTSNDDVLRDGDFVLVDAGGRYGGYVSDISRTWPVNGRFSPAQRDLYTAVLNVQRHCITLCRETAGYSLQEIQQVAEVGLYDELSQLGFDLSNGAIANVLFPHHVGHYAGIDLHDCGTYGRSLRLKAGHVLTIEPGIYVPDVDKWPKHFRGMAIRIEDTVYVGEEHPVVLTVEAAKEIDDIEALREG